MRLALAALLSVSTPASAKLLLSQKDALALAFPGAAAVERKTAYLSAEQVRSAEKLAQVKMDSKVWTYYVGRSSSGAAGYAYFNRVTVRTMPATVMVALDGAGRIRFIEILSFDEPDDYLPMRRWLDLFAGRALDFDLRVRGGIRNISGASLSAAAITDCARRVLAVHKVLHP